VRTTYFAARLFPELLTVHGEAPIDASRRFHVAATPLAVWRELSE